MKLPPFIELYRALIATPSISATDSALDQSNEALINLLAGWFADLGFRVEIQPVPDTRHKFNLLASIGENSVGKKAAERAAAGCSWQVILIPYLTMKAAGLATLSL